MNYPYANGIISAIEVRLFNRSHYAKLEKVEKAGFLKQLREFGYGGAAASIEEAIAMELTGLREFLNGISPNRNLTDLFFIEIDAVNIKAALKRKHYSAVESVYMPGGNIAQEALEAAVFSDDYALLDKSQTGLIREIAAAATACPDARTFSITADKMIYAYVFRRLPLLADPALRTYFQTAVDAKNVVMMIRSRVLGWDWPEFSAMFIPGGTIPISVFAEAYPAADEALPGFFKEHYQEKIGLGLKKYFQSENIDSLERLFEQLLIETMKNYRYDSFGIGPIIYYYLAKQAEASNIRLLYAGGEADLIDY